jgi:seryl-tRNA synthetase
MGAPRGVARIPPPREADDPMLDKNLLTDDLDGVAKRLAARRAGDVGLEAIRELNLRRKKLQKEYDDLTFENK